ncbi:MAG TPA: hypothetical protein PK765_06400 [bacterium]|nr:hypothetical protein [bacterium]
MYYTVSQQIPELRRVLESIDNDLVRYTQLLLAAIYQRILPPFCEVVRQLDADVMVCDEHSCPNALMFLALLDALKQSLDIVTAVADSDNRNKLSLVLTTAHGDLFREVLGLAKRNSRSAK